MTIELKLPPEWETRVKACADEEFSGNVQAMLLDALECYFETQHHPDIEAMLLEAVDSPGIPMPTDWREVIKSKNSVKS